MRLTVGPLPAAVYWRRRAVVLVLLASVALVISYSCGGPNQSAANADPRAASTPTAGTPTSTLLRPEVPRSSTTPAATAFTLSTSGATRACGDAEMKVTAVAASAQVPLSQAVDVTIKIKNASTRTCSRDVGADMQELRLVQGSVLIWSSDDCNPNKGHNVSSFAPGKELTFTLRWSGKVSRTGTGSVTCGPTAPGPQAGVYQLVGRLDKIMSEPFSLHVSG